MTASGAPGVWLRVRRFFGMTTQPQGETYTFTLAYDGAALADHRMPVRELAPALLALGEAFDRANAIVNEDRAQVSLDVRATEAGSFEIDLVYTLLITGAVPLLTGPGLTAALNLKDLLFDNGLFSLIRRLNNRPPEVIERNENNVTIRDVNGNVNVYNINVLRLSEDRTMRTLVREVIEPVTRDGVDVLQVREGNETLETVRKDDIPAFEVDPPEPDGTAASEFTLRGVFLQPAATRLVGRGLWRLRDGGKTNSYEMADPAFRREVEGGLRVGAKDTLVCDVTVQQTLNDDGVISARYRVDRVSQHIPYTGPQQLRLSDGATPPSVPDTSGGQR